MRWNVVGELATNKTSSGSGLHWMSKPARLWASLSVTGVARVPKRSGNRYRPFTASVPFVIPTSGKPTNTSSQASVRKAVGKETGRTSYIERFNNTVRQRIGRLVRQTLSFSKKFGNHIAAVWDFVHHYNASLQL